METGLERMCLTAAKKGCCEHLGREVAEEEGVVIEGTAVIIVGTAVVIARGTVE